MDNPIPTEVLDRITREAREEADKAVDLLPRRHFERATFQWVDGYAAATVKACTARYHLEERLKAMEGALRDVQATEGYEKNPDCGDTCDRSCTQCLVADALLSTPPTT